MAYQLHLKSVRAELPPRREPYWGPPLERSRYIGFRKLADGTGTWIARMLDEHGDHRYQRLGWVTDQFGYTEAKREAEAWFKGKDSGLTDEPPTVEDACKQYVEDRRTQKGEATAYDAEIRFKRTIYGKPIGEVRLNKLTTKRLKEWRAEIPGTNSAKDREWRSLKAALNLAVVNRQVSADRAIEWKSVPALMKVDGRRELFLDLKQRRALLKASKGITRKTLEAAALTGARPGELVRLTAADVDVKLGTITFNGKTGARTVPLSPAALKFFKRLCKGVAPSAPLLPWAHSVEWSREIRAAAERAKLPDGVVLYTMRHSFITEALRGGMATLDVARLTGTSLAMIQSHYGHLVVDSARERLAQVTML